MLKKIRSTRVLAHRPLIHASLLAFLSLFALLGTAPGQTDYQQLHSFSNSVGIQPLGRLIEASDGDLYGTTQGGGATNRGVVFKIQKDGTGFTVVTSLTNAWFPFAGVLEGPDGNLYGTTFAGGSSGAGAIYRVDKSGNNFAVIHNFDPPTGGSSRASLILGLDGSLYGVTGMGGSNNIGTVFRVNTNGTGYTVLHHFRGPIQGDGANPVAALLQTSDGVLYGTTQNGGSNNFGTVFKLNTNGTGYSVLRHFAGMGGNDGSQPLANLIRGSDGYLYGTTSQGRAHNAGSVFRLDVNGGNYAVLHGFATNNHGGTRPSAALVEGNDGALYGTARFTGTSITGTGTVFRISRDGSGFTVLHSFTGAPDGDQPQAALLKASNNSFYGVTTFGGVENLGTMFRLFHAHVLISGISKQPAGTQLTCTNGYPGQSYQIQAATNLAPPVVWSVIGSNTASAGGGFQFVDTNSAAFPARFYRTARP